MTFGDSFAFGEEVRVSDNQTFSYDLEKLPPGSEAISAGGGKSALRVSAVLICHYIVDFETRPMDDTLEYVEVKGFES